MVYLSGAMRCAVALLAAVVFVPSAAADDLLPSVVRENRLIAVQIRAEVESTLRAAAARMADDPAAVEQNYQACKTNKETHMLPLVMDLTNPSPGLGWHNRERQSLAERGPVDAVLALALILWSWRTTHRT